MELYILKDKIPVLCEDREDLINCFNIDMRRVAKDKIGDTEVSTVFLCIDHSFGAGPPILFETMVFGGPLDQEMKRYSTYEEAEKGHKEMCERVLKTLEYK